ncbi:hypothetical protein P7K49_001688, partial [Saguinus oedipus]
QRSRFHLGPTLRTPTRLGSPDAPASSPHPTPQPTQRGLEARCSWGCRAVSLAGRHRPS